MMNEIILRHMELTDLDIYYDLNKPTRKFHKFNGPYFAKETEFELKDRINNLRTMLLEEKYENNKLMIVNAQNDELIGEVTWYWKSEETKWMEIGIVIFNENYWSAGIGYKALVMWIDKLFSERNDIIRLGLTTWSGNERMMRLAQKLGFLCEATYRKARIVNGEYYDSVSYGILKDEWLANK